MADIPHVIVFEGGTHPPLFLRTDKLKPQELEYETAEQRQKRLEKEEKQ